MGTTLADVVNGHLNRRGWSFEKLAEKAGLPRNTVYRWTRAEVKRVRSWPDLLKVARALDLSRFQANALLQVSGHPSIEILATQSPDEEQSQLLSRWTNATPSNLPAQLTSFVGRHDEIEQLAHFITTGRLVTLTGPGGTGKTRLALEAANAVIDAFDEVWFVDLSSVHDPRLAMLTISQTLDLAESIDAPPLRALQEYLRDRKALLVLDNFEQVIEAAPLIAEILSGTQTTRIIVTSRARLNLRGDQEFRGPPLALPQRASGLDEIMSNPAVVLFAERARTVEPSFELNPETALLIAAICTRLDGLPLAIELTAVRTRQVKLTAMLDRTPGSLSLTGAGPRDAPNRQRTLRSTIAWSYDLLRPEEQSLFSMLEIFVGGFTDEAATVVFEKIGPRAFDVAAGLESLDEQSLIRRTWDQSDEVRFHMLETIREYAHQKLLESELFETVSEAAYEYFVGLAERADLDGGGQDYWLPRLVAEHDNFRARLGWCKERNDHEAGLRLSVALGPLWNTQDRQVEAYSWLETFMAAEDQVPPHLKAKGLLWRGALLFSRSVDGPAALRLYSEALTLFRLAGDLDGTSETLQVEGDVYRHLGDWETAVQRYSESLEIATKAGNHYLAAHANMGLALCAQDHDMHDDARQYWHLMLASAETSGNRLSIALALNGLGEMARSDQDWDEAERLYNLTLGMARELHNETRMALALHNLGYIALHRDDSTLALQQFMKSLTLYKDQRHLRGVAECLAGLGRVEAATGRSERAARLCGAAEAMLADLDARLDALDRAEFDRAIELLQGHLGEQLEQLLTEGRAIAFETAVQYALNDDMGGQSPPHPLTRHAKQS